MQNLRMVIIIAKHNSNFSTKIRLRNLINVMVIKSMHLFCHNIDA